MEQLFARAKRGWFDRLLCADCVLWNLFVSLYRPAMQSSDTSATIDGPRDSIELSPGIQLNFFTNKYMRHAVQRTASMEDGGGRRQRRIERQRSLEGDNNEAGATENSASVEHSPPGSEIPSATPPESDVPKEKVRGVSFSAQLEDVRSIPARPESKKKKKTSSASNRKKANAEVPHDAPSKMIDLPIASLAPSVTSPVRVASVPVRVPLPIPPSTTRLLFTLGENDFEHDLTNEGDSGLSTSMLDKNTTSISPKIAHLSLESRPLAHESHSDTSSLSSLPVTPQMLGESHDATRQGADAFQLGDALRRFPSSGGQAWGSLLQQQQSSHLTPSELAAFPPSVFRRRESTTSITSAASSTASSGGSSISFGFATTPSPLPESRELSPAFGQPMLEVGSARVGPQSAMQRRAEAMGALGNSLRLSGSGLPPAASRSLPVSPAAVIPDSHGNRHFQPSILLAHMQNMQTTSSQSQPTSFPLPPPSPAKPSFLRIGSGGSLPRPLISRSTSDPIAPGSPPTPTTNGSMHQDSLDFPSPSGSPKLLPSSQGSPKLLPITLSSAHGSPKLQPFAAPAPLPDPALSAAQLTLATAHAAHLYHVDLGRTVAGARAPVASMRRSLELGGSTALTTTSSSPAQVTPLSPSPAPYQEPLLRRGGARGPASPPPTQTTLEPIASTQPPLPVPAATILKQRAMGFPGSDSQLDEASLPPRAQDASTAQNSLLQQNFTQYGWQSPSRPQRYVNGGSHSHNVSIASPSTPIATRHAHSASMPSEPTSPRSVSMSSSPRHLRQASGALVAQNQARMFTPTHSVHIKSFSFGGGSAPLRYDSSSPSGASSSASASPPTSNSPSIHQPHHRAPSFGSVVSRSGGSKKQNQSSNVARLHGRSTSRAAVADLTAALFIIKNSPSSNRRKL
jgi:hypothetical protein